MDVLDRILRAILQQGGLPGFRTLLATPEWREVLLAGVRYLFSQLDSRGQMQISPEFEQISHDLAACLSEEKEVQMIFSGHREVLLFIAIELLTLLADYLKNVQSETSQ